jgi:hypothetical protein
VNQTARPFSLTYPNGQSTLYQYFDNLGDQRLKQIANFGAGATVLSQFDYSYDAEGQILSGDNKPAPRIRLLLDMISLASSPVPILSAQRLRLLLTPTIPQAIARMKLSMLHQHQSRSTI